MSRRLLALSPAAILFLLACQPSEPGTPSSTNGPTQEHEQGLSGFGQPLPGLTPAQSALFLDGQSDFEEIEDVADGLGPVFNDRSCAACHSSPATGGSSTTTETRFARVSGGSFNPLTSFGGTLAQVQSIGQVAGCRFAYVGETVPSQANVVAGRRTTPLFGLGLVDAVPDSTFVALASAQRANTPATAGRVNLVANVVSGGQSVGKFGWKSQVPGLEQFAGDAYLNEMGITNPRFPNENCPQGQCQLLSCNPVPALNDDGSGVTAFTNFMQLLGAPPRGTVNNAVRQGEQVFQRIGCPACHVPSLTTGPNPIAALNRVTFSPYSDFLIHDMGTLGDGIEQGQATGSEMRTAPLWGLSAQPFFLHDGRAPTIETAISAHAGQGAAAASAFNALNATDRSNLLAFLRSL